MGDVKYIRNNNLGADKVLVTHTDLDGIGCAFIFLKCYPKGNVFFADYHNVNEIVLEAMETFPDHDIMITDISVDKGVAHRLDQRGKVTLLDHHASALWMMDQYEWAAIDVSGLKCGTRMIYEMLSAWFNIQDLEPTVDTIEQWDLWGYDTYPLDEAIEYQFMFEFMGRADFLFELLKNPEFVHDVQWAWLLDRLVMKYEAYYQDTKDIIQLHQNGPFTVGIALADQYISLMGHRLIEELDLEYVMFIDNRHGKASLRGRGNINLTELAKQAGGGGHKNGKTAGFRLGAQAVEFVKNIEGAEQ